MKVNLKKNSFLISLLILSINCTCVAQKNEKKELYNYLDEIIPKSNFLYLKISSIKKCKTEYLFGIAMMDYNDNLSNKYKIYDYKGSLIVFDLNEEKDLRVINFFDSYFKETNSNISNIPKGRQSLVNEYALYFINKNFIKDLNKTKDFMMVDCENK